VAGERPPKPGATAAVTCARYPDAAGAGSASVRAAAGALCGPAWVERAHLGTRPGWAACPGCLQGVARGVVMHGVLHGAPPGALPGALNGGPARGCCTGVFRRQGAALGCFAGCCTEVFHRVLHGGVARRRCRTCCVSCSLAWARSSSPPASPACRACSSGRWTPARRGRVLGATLPRCALPCVCPDAPAGEKRILSVCARRRVCARFRTRVHAGGAGGVVRVRCEHACA
jgi:hypothetical protein